MSLRSFAAFFFAAIMLVSAIVEVPAANAASEDEETHAFAVLVFPHESTAVSFWNSWGAPRSGGRRHQGTDIMSPQGTRVLAVADGIIETYGWHRMSGYYVRIDHGDGWKTAYMHLNNDTLGTNDGAGGEWMAFFPTLRIGQEVSAGDAIGFVGNSGNAEGTRHHTHFEIKYDGKKLNPYPFLMDALERSMRHPEDELPF